MQRKYLIAFGVIFGIFFIAMAIVLFTKSDSRTPTETEQYHAYATNETFTTTETTNETFEISSKDYYYDHIGNLTKEQEAVKLHMNSLIYNDFVAVYHSGCKVKSIDVLDTSDKETVFALVTMVIWLNTSLFQSLNLYRYHLNTSFYQNDSQIV